jgi:metal transporter CNNM
MVFAFAIKAFPWKLACLISIPFLLIAINRHHPDDNQLTNYSSGLRSDSSRVRFLQTKETTVCTLDCCRQYEATLCSSSDDNWTKSIPLALQILLVIFLTCLSSLYSGLTLGLLGLDKTGLEIIMAGESPERAEMARKVYSIRKNGNLLLCTLILGNVTCNSFLSILMEQYFGGLIALIASTILIVILGEIMPQAIIAKYALEIGSRSVPLVTAMLYILYPFAYPLAFCLNKMLGNELPTTYSNAELTKLLEIHVAEGKVDAEIADAMTGALKFKNLVVEKVMTTIDKVYMLDVEEKLSFKTIADIFKTGYSRVPVYEVSRNNIIGLLLVKDLIFVDPEDDTPVRSFVQIFGRGVHVVWLNDKLGDILKELKKGKSHMALVRDVNNDDESRDPFYEIKGIVTLEDIIEEILGDEIIDETDAFVDGTHSQKVFRSDAFDWGRLRLLDSKIVDQKLSDGEVNAITAHLRTNYASYFTLLSDNQLRNFVKEASVEELTEAVLDMNQQLPHDLIYERGVETDVCTLVLSGMDTASPGNIFADCFLP